MLKGLAGKSAVVTGGSGGIGAAVCRRLVAEGSRVVVADVNGEAADKLAAELRSQGAEAVAVECDVSSAAGVAAGIGMAVAQWGRLDLFHANAGVESKVRTVEDFDAADFDRVFAINVKGAFLSAQGAVRQFRAQGGPGGLLVTASIAALMGTAGTSVYNASKHAVHGLVRCLAAEVGSLGIRVNMLAPGVVDTRMMRALEVGLGGLAGLDGPGFQAAMAQGVPLGRYATPEEIAATAAWVLSDEVPYMHGEVVTVGGGIAP